MVHLKRSVQVLILGTHEWECIWKQDHPGWSGWALNPMTICLAGDARRGESQKRKQCDHRVCDLEGCGH